jgi:glycosyltransferase involved in cell wall biosynthesis
LPQALRSIQNQSLESLEVQIIADGASTEIIEIAKTFSMKDKRFNLQSHQKSIRRGEEHRHDSILSSPAQFITYLADDDLFLPHHVQYMVENIEGRDFVNQRPTYINRHNQIWCMPTDVSTESSRTWHLGELTRNSISLSGVMHTKDSYLRLEEGWAPTPMSFPWTDLYMWRKFLRREDFKFITTPRCTVLKFLGDSNRYDEQKIEQNQRWFGEMQDPGWVQKWDQKVERSHQIAAAEAFVQLTNSQAKTLPH